MEATIPTGSWPHCGCEESPRSPEWHSLRARLGAAHAARSAMANLRGKERQGSFSPESAHAMDVLGQCLADVNRTALSNVKGGGGIGNGVAGEANAGGRGWK